VPISISFFPSLVLLTKAEQNEKFNYLWKHEKQPLCRRTFFIRAESLPLRKKETQYNIIAELNPNSNQLWPTTAWPLLWPWSDCEKAKRGGGGGLCRTENGANSYVICFYPESSEFHFQHARQRANSSTYIIRPRYIKPVHARGPRATEMAQRRVHSKGDPQTSWGSAKVKVKVPVSRKPRIKCRSHYGNLDLICWPANGFRFRIWITVCYICLILKVDWCHKGNSGLLWDLPRKLHRFCG